jgi:Helix-turn-helix.
MESQKEAIERMLKQKGKKKRELAVYLEITENSINRMLRNNNIGMGKLQKIADFLGVDLVEILPRKLLGEDSYQFPSNTFMVNENIMERLSEALLAGNRTNESQSRTIESLVKILEEKRGK